MVGHSNLTPPLPMYAHLLKMLAFLIEILDLSDGVLTHFMASMFSGFVTTVASMPVDIAKTR